MARVQLALFGLIGLLTVAWMAGDSFYPQPFSYFAFRNVFVQYSGILAIGMMSVAMYLATRPRWLERPFQGLDKIYRLHKWLGITVLIVSITHWWMAQGSKWMVSWGWIARPQRRNRGAFDGSALESWFHSQRELAETIGEWAFYLAVIFLLLALIKRFPYHLFAKTHKVLAVIYLALVFHTIVLTKFSYWTQPVGLLLAGLLIAGLYSSIVVLTGRVGRRQKVSGEIKALTYYPELRVLETVVQLRDDWPGHAAGQFAFVTSDQHEGAHPYTIASSWDKTHPEITFITKALGDHTSQLPKRLHEGLTVQVEGPYGCFDFKDSQPRQIWIGAGIGITPFISRMKQLARSPGSQSVDLFHSTMDFSAEAIEKIKADAAAAGVRLHLNVDARDGLLNGQAIRQAVPDWQHASVWFCGPPGFGQALKRDFVAHGMPRGHFHQELFHLR